LFDDEVAAILTRLRRARVICSDETTVRVDGRTHWNWVFQNDRVVIRLPADQAGLMGFGHQWKSTLRW
jgi:hypothetical protein